MTSHRSIITRLRNRPVYNSFRVLRGIARNMYKPGTINNRGILIPVEHILSNHMRHVLYTGMYEDREYDLIKSYLQPDDLVLELGTGIGFITTLCAQICGSEAVCTVEANPGMIPVIEKLFALNRVHPELISAAVNENGGDQELYLMNDYWSTSVVNRGDTRKITIQSIGFSSIVEKYNPTFLVIDIEGAETDLTGCTIPDSVKHVLIELHGHVIGSDATQSVRNWLSGQRFRPIVDHGDKSVVFYQR